jgi:hypothetical protein
MCYSRAMQVQEPPHEMIERSSERTVVRMQALCRVVHGVRNEGWLENISARGCCFVSTRHFFSTGSQVLLKPNGLNALWGSVRWTNGPRCGVEFEQPLYGPVLQHLIERYGDAKRPLAFETNLQGEADPQRSRLRQRLLSQFR